MDMNQKTTFLNTGAGILPVVAIIAAMLCCGVFAPVFFSMVNASNVWIQFAMFAAIGSAVALTVRAKGPDFSIGAMTGLAMVIMRQFLEQGYGWETGFAVALAVAIGIGALNGVIAQYTPIPVSIFTLVLCFVLWKLVDASRMPPYMLDNAPSVAHTPFGAYLFMVAIVLPIFFLVFFSRLGTPFAQRQKGEKNPCYVLAYVVSAVIGAVVAVFLVSRIRAVLVSSVGNYELYIAFAAAALYASRAFDNRIFPVLYVLVPAFAWCVTQNALVIMGMNSFLQLIVNLIFAVIMVTMAWFATGRKLWQERMALDTSRII